MQRRFPLTCLFLSLILSLFSASRVWAAKPLIAIFNLRPTNIEALGYDGELLYSLVSALTRDDSLQIMPRREMEDALLQAGLAQSDNPKLALQAGKVLGVNYVLLGQVSKHGVLIKAKLHLLSVAQGGIIKTWPLIFSGRDDILNKAPALAKKISRALKYKNKRYQQLVRKAEKKTQIKISSLQATNKGNCVILSWRFNPEDPINHFNIYRSENKNGPYQYVGRTNKNIFKDKQVSKGHSYCYIVAAALYNGKEVKLKPVVQIKNIGEKLPHPPLILEARGYIKRAWIKFIPSLLNDQDGFKIKTYNLYRSSNNEDWTKVKEISAKTRSQSELAFYAEDTDLEDSTTYRYCITSANNEKESPYSDSVEIKTTSPPELSIEKDNLLRRIDLSWSELENIQGYYLYRRVQDEEWQKIAKIRKNYQTQYSDKSHLEDGLTYEYYLTAYDSKGETGPSNIVQGKTKDLPLPPTNLSAKNGLVKSVLLTWTPIEDKDIGGYTIYRGLTPEKMYEVAKIKGFAKDSYMDKGKNFDPLKDGETYYYAVASYNLYKAEGPLSRPVHARTKPRPTAVKDFTAQAQADKIILTWHKNSEYDIRAYILYRSRNQGSWAKLATLPADQTRYEDDDLKPESTYIYKIIAIDEDDLESDPSKTQEILSPITNN